jgi:hypothetical protein
MTITRIVPPNGWIFVLLSMLPQIADLQGARHVAHSRGATDKLGDGMCRAQLPAVHQ